MPPGLRNAHPPSGISPGPLSPTLYPEYRGEGVSTGRETPSLLINEVIPIGESIGRLTTAVALKLDPARHPESVVTQLDPLLRRHKGNTEVYLQVATSPTQRVVMRLDRERFVKPTKELVDELELLLGGGSVQLCGAGTRRQKLKQQQQQSLFKEYEAAGGEGGEAAEEEEADVATVEAAGEE